MAGRSEGREGAEVERAVVDFIQGGYSVGKNIALTISVRVIAEGLGATRGQRCAFIGNG